MSVNLFAGIRRLHLLYTTRYDPIREDDVRDDLLGIKVWISTTPNFDFTTIQPLEFAVGSGVSIDDLEVNTQYYLRYAFISKIDPDTFTVSQQLTAKTYDEATRVYGELTNDPVYLSRAIGSTQIDWAPVNGVFRVIDLNTEVTGANTPGKGPVYSIVSNSITNGINATINPVTGEFSATSWSGVSRTGKVTFKAVYDGIEVLRDWNLVDGIGQDAAQLTLTLSPDNFIYKDATAVLSSVPRVTAVASLTNITGTPQFTVIGYSENGTALGSVPFTQLNNSITITNQQFHINNNISYAVVRAQLGTVFDEDTIKRLNNGTDAITVDVSNPVVQLQADENGLVDSAEYTETGTEIEVYQGSIRVPVSTTLAFSPSWRITNVAGTGITPDPTELRSQFAIAYDRHDEMLLDTASIEYTVEYKTSAGFVGTRVVKQSFSKSKQGVTGSSAPLVVLRAERLAFVKLANGASVVPEFIDIVAQVSNIVTPVYLWRENGSVVSGQTASTLRVNKFSNVGNKTFTVEVSGVALTGEPISRTTSFTLYYIQEGSDAISSAAFPQQNTISCDSNGIPDPAQFPIIIDTIAVRGATVLANSSNSYSLQDIDGVTVSAVAGQPGKFQITNVSEYYGSFVIAMTAGGVTFYHPVYTTKVVDGNSAPVINLTTNNQIFVKRKDGSYSMSQTTITATSQNVTGNYAWYVDNVLQAGQTASTFSVAQFAPTASKVVRCERGGVFDVMTIYSIEEGTDAITVGLTNESQSLAYDESGNLHPGQDINSVMIAVRGGTVLSSPAVTFSLVSTTNGLVAAIGTTTGVITVTEPATAGNNKQFLAVFRATIAGSGATFDKTLAINVTKDGATGRRTAELKVFQWAGSQPTAPSGSSSYNWANGTYTLPSEPGLWTLTAPASSPGQKLYQATIRYSDVLTAATTTVSWTGAVVSEAGASGNNGAAGAAGLSAPVVNVTATNQIFVVGKNTGVASPATSVLSAQVNNIPTPVYEWRVDNVVQTGQTGSSFTISSFTTGTRVVRVTATSGSISAFDQITIYAVREGDDSIIGGLENENQTISCDSNGTPIAGQFPVASRFVVLRGAVELTSGVTYSKVSETGMTSTINSTTGVISATAISATSASATYRATIGTLTLDKVFSLNKSNNGAAGQPGASITGPSGAVGITTRIAYQLVSQTLTAPTYSTTTTGGSSLPGASWQATPPTATVGNVVWYSYGRYNANAFFHEGIDANTTAWSAPIAASVFQDIKSDNWTGATPSTTANFSSGYYLRKDTGSIWATNVFMQGSVLALGTTTGITGTVSIEGASYPIVPAMAASGTGQNADTSGKVRAGLFAFSNGAANTSWNVGVVGSGGDAGKGIGVIGSGTQIGVYGVSTNASSPGVFGRGLAGTGQAGLFEGYVTVSGALTVSDTMTALGNLTCWGNISAFGTITASGNITAFNSSDQRLKNNIQRITNPLEKLRNLGGYSYDWTPEYLSKYSEEIKLGLVKPHDVGVIAQQVLTQLPEAVATRADGTLAVNYEKLIPLLIEAVLELDRNTLCRHQPVQ